MLATIVVVIILAVLVILDIRYIVGEKKINLLKAIDRYLLEKKTPNTPIMKDNLENLKLMKGALRYKNCSLAHFKKILDSEQQFGAVCIYFNDKRI